MTTPPPPRTTPGQGQNEDLPPDESRRLDSPTHTHGSQRISYDEFLAQAGDDTLGDTRAEWIAGKVVMAGPASLRHQDIVNFLVEILSTYADIHGLGKVTNGPFQMKLATSGREPDVLFVASDHLDRLEHTYVDGPADLVVEVMSPETRGRDRGDKFFEYQDAGIPEYWLIDPHREMAEFYRLDDRGRYQLAILPPDGIHRSWALPGFWLRVGWLWMDPLPRPTRALLEIDRTAYARYLRDELRQAGLE